MRHWWHPIRFYKAKFKLSRKVIHRFNVLWWEVWIISGIFHYYQMTTGKAFFFEPGWFALTPNFDIVLVVDSCEIVETERLHRGLPSSHTKDFKNGSPCLHGNDDEVGTTKHNWSAWCQYNVTGWVSIWAYDMLSQWGSTIKWAYK